MPSIYDYINPDILKNEDLNSFPKNAPQELPDDPVELYETAIKIAVDKMRSEGKTPNYKESFLAIDIDGEKCVRDSDRFIKLATGNVVHPGDSEFDIGDLISIRCSNDNKVRFNVVHRDRFYITAPDKDGTFPAFKGFVDVRPTQAVIEKPTDSKTFQYDGDLLKDVNHFVQDGTKCIELNSEFFLKNFTWLVKRTKLNAKIKEFAVDKDHCNRFYQALKMFKSGSMTSLKRKRAAADHYKLDYKNFSSVVGSASSLGLMNRNVKI